MFGYVSQPFETIWDGHRTVHCLLPHSSHQQCPVTEILTFMPYIRRYNITIMMEYIPSLRMEHDVFSCRLGELVKEYEWWQNVFHLASVETLRLWTGTLFMKKANCVCLQFAEHDGLRKCELCLLNEVSLYLSTTEPGNLFEKQQHPYLHLTKGFVSIQALEIAFLNAFALRCFFSSDKFLPN